MGSKQTFSTESSFSSMRLQAVRIAAPDSAHMTGTEASKALGFSAWAAISAMRWVADRVVLVELRRRGVRVVRADGAARRARIGRVVRRRRADMVGCVCELGGVEGELKLDVCGIGRLKSV